MNGKGGKGSILSTVSHSPESETSRKVPTNTPRRRVMRGVAAGRRGRVGSRRGRRGGAGLRGRGNGGSGGRGGQGPEGRGDRVHHPLEALPHALAQDRRTKCRVKKGRDDDMPAEVPLRQ